ncbi:hypothetical protein [Psychrobacter maritimus]|jgi:hypothetical protein|uniref:hypothetical protein n=1 Tax=Psychrobacter maritimus TaxID=256325 RepID=UPI003564545F
MSLKNVPENMAAKSTASTNTDSKNIMPEKTMPEKTMPKNNRLFFIGQPFITQRCGECSVNERIFC